MKVHPEVAEAEERLEEFKGKEARATGQEKVDLILLVDAQAKIVDELRWQHSPRPMVTQDHIDAAKYTTDTEHVPADRAY